jgi:hypothetical protein
LASRSLHRTKSLLRRGSCPEGGWLSSICAPRYPVQNY